MKAKAKAATVKVMSDEELATRLSCEWYGFPAPQHERMFLSHDGVQKWMPMVRLIRKLARAGRLAGRKGER